MNAEGLLAHYARIADAPDAIARLRRFVVDLAVRGRLVAQESGDEPAAKLLARITAEKTRLIQAGTIRKAKPAPPSEEAPFAIPSGWAWSHIAEIGILSPRNDAADDMQASFVPMNLISAEYGEPNGHEVRLWREIKRGYTHFSEGDVGLAKITPCFENGKSTVFRNLAGQLGSGTTELHVVRPLLINPDYVLVFLKSPHFIESGIPRMTGTAGQKRVPTDYFAYSPFPVPPLAEQQRIVAKVDELMALCDQLEAARAQREATRDRLAAASLARLNAPDPETFHADARFALDALPALTTRPDQIKQLRQTILNLAVRGKLVRQDPTDEPASELLTRIANQKSLMVKDGIIKAEQPAPFPSESKSPDLPAGWAKVRLGALSKVVTSGSRDWAKHYSEEGAIFIRMGNLSKDHYRLRLDHIQRVNPPSDGEGTRTRLEAGDILVSITGEVGMLGLIPDGFGEAYINQHTAMVRPMPELKGRYLAEFLRSSIAKDQFNAPQRGIKNSFRLSDVTELEIPLPPLAEQHRIVAKLDELMALSDQLEATLTTGETTRSRLLDALLREALAPAPTVHVEHPRAAVSGYVISRLASRRNFGRTAHMKHLYLAESRLGLKLGGRYERQAAGPLDTGIYELEKQAAAAGWYTYNVQTLPSGKEKVSYVPGKALTALAEEGAAVLGPSRKEMDRLIDLMGGLKTDQVEIIATLFAAWNDALLDGHTPDDNWVVKEVREHWHASKQRFAPAELHKWLGWMRQNDVIPLGHPPRTMQQTTMEL